MREIVVSSAFDLIEEKERILREKLREFWFWSKFLSRICFKFVYIQETKPEIEFRDHELVITQKIQVFPRFKVLKFLFFKNK